jgi:hypothetical protein
MIEIGEPVKTGGGCYMIAEFSALWLSPSQADREGNEAGWLGRRAAAADGMAAKLCSA